jgi:TATA-box binding protein (TBP) (component of TFIID and TFIIIB)
MSTDALQEYAAAFFALFSSYEALRRDLKHVRVEDFRVCTMTIGGKLNVSSVDLKLVEDKFGHDDMAVHRLVAPGVPLVLKDVSNNKGKFYNQLTMTYEDTSVKAVKLFCNGSLLVTGCKNMHDFELMTSVVCRLIGAEVNVVERTVHLINCNVRLNLQLDLEALATCLRDRAGLSPEYNADEYPGLKVRVNGGACLLMFHSGSMIITGVHKVDNIRTALEFVARFVDAHVANVQKPAGAVAAKGGFGAAKPAEPLVHGYPSSLYWAVAGI